MKYIVGKHCIQPDLVGMKAWNLYKLQKQYTVPEFVVVSTKAFMEYRDYGTAPDELAAEIDDILKRIFKGDPVAVRSSGTAEDLSGKSYAGMYVTVLNVTGVDSVMKAIVDVWLSNDSKRVQKYRKQMNLESGNMAVIIQRQLQARVSGVMATRHPMKKNTVIIECCRGLGEKLVSGKITPSRYCLKGRKKIERHGEDILSKPALNKLIKTGQHIEKMFGSPQDIEWAFYQGTLYILQSRPLTSITRATKKPGRVWCNANVRETIPDPISPMGYSFFEKIWFPGIMIDTFGFPMSIKQYEKYPPVERVLGRLYWNINNTAAYGKSIEPILKFTGAGDAIDPQLGRAMESIDTTTIPNLLSTTKMILFSVSAMVRMPYYLTKSFFQFRHARKVIDQACVDIDGLTQGMYLTDDFNKGIKNVRNWVQIISGRLSKRYFSGILVSVFYLAILSKILGWRMGKKGEAIARMTTYGLLDKTGEMVLAMRALATYVHKKIPHVNLETLNELYDKDHDFRTQYDFFIAEFGHRGPAEFDVASVTWHENNSLVYGILQNPPVNERNRERSEIIKDIMKILPSFERYITRLFIPRIETLTAIRENGKHYVFKILSKVKDQLLMLEKELIEKGFLEKERDVFFLRLDDLEAIRDGVLSKKQTLKILYERKAEWQKYLCIDVPDIVYEDGEQVFMSTREQDSLTGVPVSYGRVRGRARIIRSFSDARTLEKGDIMITHHTDPGWTPLFSIVSGVVIEVGGLICHAAMVARELGLPAIVLPGAISSIPDNARIELDAEKGTVTLLHKRIGES